jgi:acyl-coenzyme A thioesterase PaaI-like protein
MSSLLRVYEQAARLPRGRWLFSRLFSHKAPYFATVRPSFTELRPGYARLTIRKRRRVHNHLGTVHVIAILNGLEAAMGALAEATLPPGKRWIPKGMEVDYTAKATSDITCVAETDPTAWTSGDPDVPVRVTATRDDGTVVVSGAIRLWVTDKPR